MPVDDLKAALAAILVEEERIEIDWDRIELLSERAYVCLVTTPEILRECPYEDIVDYLASFRRREADTHFGEAQREWLRTYLGSGGPGASTEQP